MLWQLFLVLIATAASADESEEVRPTCRILVSLECETQEETPRDFPGTEEELDEFCKLLLKYADCTERVLSSCETNDEHFNQYIREFATTARRVCKEDSLIRPAVVAILPCLKEYRGKIAHCLPTAHVDIAFLADALNETGFTDIAELGETDEGFCLTNLYLIGCTAASSSHLCGDAAKDVIINLIEGLDTPFRSCPEGAKESLPTIVNVLELEIQKAEDMENTIKRKK